MTCAGGRPIGNARSGLAAFSSTGEQFRSWVFTIAHRRLVDERRRVGTVQQ